MIGANDPSYVLLVKHGGKCGGPRKIAKHDRKLPTFSGTLSDRLGA